MLLNFGKASEISIYPFTGNPVITRFSARRGIYISHFNWLLSAANIVSYNIVGGLGVLECAKVELGSRGLQLTWAEIEATNRKCNFG